MAQYVPLKVETEGEDWQTWSKKYRATGNEIPLVFVIRADGEQLYGQSGAITGEALPEFMKRYLKEAGRVFPLPSARKLQTMVKTAKEHYEQGDVVAAVRTIKPITKIGKLGDRDRPSRRTNSSTFSLRKAGR